MGKLSVLPATPDVSDAVLDRLVDRLAEATCASSTALRHYRAGRRAATRAEMLKLIETVAVVQAHIIVAAKELKIRPRRTSAPMLALG